MELTLTEKEARTLRNFLRDHLQTFKFEVARTDVRDLRHSFLEQQELVERILQELEREVKD
jgi:hypothetical protein